MTGLQVEALRLRHGPKADPTLDGVSLDAPRNSLTSLLGPSGCGKSSVLRVIAGLLVPDSGRVVLDGRDLIGVPPERRGVGLTFAAGALFPHLSVDDNVRFPLLARRVATRTAAARAAQALESVGLRGAGGLRPAMLSGGEQQRVALARALAQEPQVLLLDEPLSSVEPRLRRALREEMRTLQRQLGLTVVHVTHDHREALAMSDQIVLIRAGRVVQAGPPQALYESPVDAFAAAFMGEASIVPGHRGADGFVNIGPVVLAQRHPGLAGPVDVAVRPEAWRLRPCSGSGLPGRVARKRYLGKMNEYVVDTALGALLVHATDLTVAHEVGSPLSLEIAPRGAWVLATER